MAGQKREARLARAFAQMYRPCTSLPPREKKDVDARAKRGHDEFW
jgi:hypothetical protein